MVSKRAGRQTIRFSSPPVVESFANIGGKEEGRGPLAEYFDELGEDSYFDQTTWEKGESEMQKRVIYRALEKKNLKPADVDVIFAGEDEVITFSHTAYSRAVFGKGAVQAAKFLAGKPAGLYNMQDVIEG